MSASEDAPPGLPPGFHEPEEEPKWLSSVDPATKACTVYCVSKCAIRFESLQLNYNCYIARVDATTHICTLCNVTIKASSNNYGNSRSHLKSNHPDIIPFKDLSTDYVRSVTKKWLETEEALSKPDTAERLPALANAGNDSSAKKRKISSHFLVVAPVVILETLKDILVMAILLGCLPFGIMEHHGLGYLVKKLYKKTVEGCSRRRLTIACKEKFVKMKAEKVSLLKAVMKAPLYVGEKMVCPPDDPELPRGPMLGATQDGWTSPDKKTGMLGVCFTFMDPRFCPWRVVHFTAACSVWRGTHTIAEGSKQMKEVFRGFGLSVKDFSTTTQDTTASSIGILREEAEIKRLKCLAHLNQLLMKLGIGVTSKGNPNPNPVPYPYPNSNPDPYPTQTIRYTDA
jgi:hypothetical protein